MEEKLTIGTDFFAIFEIEDSKMFFNFIQKTS